MSDHSFFNSSVPQFGTAEYARKPGAETCQSCGAAISDRYFRINGALACPICASEAQAKAPKDTHVAFVRGLTFGIGGAILGLIVYAAFGILSGFVIGYISRSGLDCRKSDQERVERDWRFALSNRCSSSYLCSGLAGGGANRHLAVSEVRKGSQGGSPFSSGSKRRGWS